MMLQVVRRDLSARGPRDLGTLLGLLQLTVQLRVMNKHEENERLLVNLIQLYHTTPGDEWSVENAIDSMLELCGVYYSQGKVEDMRAIYEAVAAKTNELRQIPFQRARCITCLALLRRLQGREEEAEVAFHVALEEQSQSYSWLSCWTSFEYGLMLSSQKRFRETATVYEDALKVALQEKGGGPRYPDFYDILTNLITTYDYLNRHQDSERLFQKGLEHLRVKTAGKIFTTPKRRTFLSRTKILDRDLKRSRLNSRVFIKHVSIPN